MLNLHPIGGLPTYRGTVSLTSSSIQLPGLQAAADPDPGLAADRDFGAARDGDADAFVRLVRQHQSRIFSLALRLTGRREDAEELAQDTFLGLHGQLRHLESAQHVRHWVSRTVTHRSIDLLRRRARRPQSVSVDQLLLAVSVEDDSGDPLLHRTLRALLLRLPDDPARRGGPEVPGGPRSAGYRRDARIALNTVKSHLRRSLDWLRAQGLERAR